MSHYIIVGCDLHDANMLLKVAYDREDPLTRTFRNDAASRSQMRAWLDRLSNEHGGAKVVFAYEASCLGFGLYDELTAAGMTCFVLAPSKMEKSPYQRRRKTDDRDAQHVLEVLRGHLMAGNKLPNVWVPDPQTRDDRELVRMRLTIGEQLSRVKSQIKTFLKRTGQTPPTEVKSWTIRHRLWLENLVTGKLSNLGPGSRASLASLLRQLDDQNREEKRLSKELCQLAKSPRYDALVKDLTIYGGVGLLTAMVFLTEIGEMHRFRNRRQLASFLGLAPSSHESGEVSDRKGHITHQGPGRVRKVLCQAVWSGLRHDGPEAKWLSAYLAEHPKRRKIGVVAAMRRLAIRLWHRASNFLGVPDVPTSMPDSAGPPWLRAGVLIAAPCTPG